MIWDDVLYRWLRYSEALYPLRDEVADIFKAKCFYDEQWVYHEQPYEPDDDTVFLVKLSDMLNNICSFIHDHVEVLKHRVDLEEEARANQEQAFQSWTRGLCPLLMQSVTRYVKHGDWDGWKTYDEVAEFLDDRTISYNSTLNAIRDWSLVHELAA